MLDEQNHAPEPVSRLQKAPRPPDQDDAHQACRVFRFARNVFFGLFLFGLALTQAGFWIVDTGRIDDAIEEHSMDSRYVPVVQLLHTQAAHGNSGPDLYAFAQQALTLGNYLLTFTSVLYCLTLLFGVKLSLVGRLGGLASGTWAFFLSLIVAVLVVPWIHAATGQMVGTLYFFPDLVDQYWQLGNNSGDLVGHVGYYWRFVGLSFVTLVLVFCAQVRAWRASQAISRRCAIAPQPFIN